MNNLKVLLAGILMAMSIGGCTTVAGNPALAGYTTADAIRDIDFYFAHKDTPEGNAAYLRFMEDIWTRNGPPDRKVVDDPDAQAYYEKKKKEQS